MAKQFKDTVTWLENLEEILDDAKRDLLELVEFYHLDENDKRQLNIAVHQWIDEIV